MNSELLFEMTAFFLKAAGECYAGKGQKTTITELPGSKVYTFDDDPFLYKDVYYTNGENSGGQTTLFHDGTPVWLMQYQGWCKDDDPQTIALLKAALTENYSKGVWRCGRGPSTFRDQEKWPGLFYTNVPLNSVHLGYPPAMEFGNFACYEAIGPDFGPPVFYHYVRGMLLES